MTHAASSTPSPTQRHARRHVEELRAVLPIAESLAEQVADLHQERRMNETSEALFEAANCLSSARRFLARAFELAEQAGRRPQPSGRAV